MATRIARGLVVGSFVLAMRFATAQATGASYTVRGVVFDSVASKPLAGAVVQLGATESSRAPWTVTTDTAGRYEIHDLPSGRYVVGFYHDALTVLGLDAPSRAVELGADRDVRVDLAVPSSVTIRALRCGAMKPFRQGMLVGVVRDAVSRAAVDGAKVTIHWRAIALDSADYRVVEEEARASIEPDGALLACGLPVDAPLDLHVVAPGHQPLDGPVVSVPVNGIARLDLLLVDSTLASGPAVIRGRAVHANGKAVASGRVAIATLGKDAPIQNGVFTIGGVPAGSWVTEARVIGAEPQRVLVTAADSGIVPATITVSDAPQMLDAVTVVGTPDRRLRVLDEILRRKRIGMGTTFLPGHPALKSALFTADVMREARGFQYKSPTEIVGRVVQYGLRAERCRNVAVYVDDVRLPDGFASLEDVAPISQVLAIETWPDIRLAPVQYRRGMMPGTAAPPSRTSRAGLSEGDSPWSVCALVLVWTKRPF